MRILMIIASMVLCGCTYNISMAHTTGTASDVIDDTASNTPTASPTISIPPAIL
jgi:hypothetical protein